MTGATVDRRSPRVVPPRMRPTNPARTHPTTSRAAAALATLVMLACLAAPPARAVEGLYLTWNDCPGGFGSTQSRFFGCGTDAGTERLIAAFSVGVPVDSVIGIEAVVDIQIATDSLPPWWQMGAGGCRDGYLTAQQNFTQDSTCVDLWNDTGVALVQDYLPTQPFGGPAQARAKAVVNIPSVNGVRLDPGPVYYAVRLMLSHQFSTACTGCVLPGCLVLNSIWLKRVPGAAGGDVLLTAPGPSLANFARWQGGAPGDCQAVHTRRVTWGRLKTFYRP
jgi:hypothetical protein